MRLGVPLLAYLLLLRPLVTLGDHAGQDHWRFYLGTWDPGPMWFVGVLLVFALLYALYRRGGRPAEARPSALRARWIVLFVLGLSVATFLWRIPVPAGSHVPVLGLPTPSFLPQYASMFVAGIVAFRRGWFETLPARAGRVGLVIGLVVLFRERFGAQGRRGRWLSAHAFTVYIVHPLVLVAVGHALSGLQAIAIVKFAVAAAVSLPLCWGLAYLVRSLPGARRVL